MSKIIHGTETDNQYRQYNQIERSVRPNQEAGTGIELPVLR
jgi:hypothetical protein